MSTLSRTEVAAIETCKFAAGHAADWDRLVDRSINGTFMHSRRFLSYHGPEKFVDHSLLFYCQGQLLAVFPAAEVLVDGRRVLQSHPGSSYGGLVVEQPLASDKARGLAAALVAHAQREAFSVIRMRVTEKIFHRRCCEELDAALFCAGFEIDGRELSSAVRLEGIDAADCGTPFNDSARRAVRKALRAGVEARLSDDFAGYWRLLEQNLDQQYRVRPTHSLAEILQLRELLPDRIFLVGGYHAGRLISGTVVFIMNDVAAHTMYMAQDYAYQQLRSLNLVLCEAIGQCARRGLKWLNYGISAIPGTRGTEMNDGLYNFKRTCGGEGVVRDMLVKNL